MRKIRIICAMLLSIAISGQVLAQTQPQSQSDNWHQVPFPVSSGSPKKVTFDFPVFTGRTTININRIKEGTLLSGSSFLPWQSGVKFAPKNNIPIPKVSFANDYLRVMSDNNISQAGDNGYLRKNRSTDLIAESSVPVGNIFGIVVGFNAFIIDEKIPKLFQDTELTTDFNRFSYGTRGWVGARFFDGFNGSFLMLKAGRGVVATRADYEYSFQGAVLSPAKTRLYKLGYNRNFVAVETRITDYRRSAFGFEIENNWFARQPFTQDQGRFGRNDFRNLTIKYTLEFLVIPWIYGVRAFVELNQNYGKDDQLLFMNNPPRIQTYLRIAF